MRFQMGPSFQGLRHIPASILLVMACALAFPATREAGMTAERAHRRWDLDDLRFSPNGGHLAFSAEGPRDGITLDRDIWILDVTTRALRQYTFSQGSDHSPQWAPSGDRLAFLSDRAGTTQIYLISLDGGEARALTKGETGVISFQWSPDGRRIAFVAAEPDSAEERKRKDEGTARVVDSYYYKDEKDPQLWIVDLETGATRQLTRPPWRLPPAYLAPCHVWDTKGVRLFVAATNDPRRERPTSRIYTLRPGDGTMEEFAIPRGAFGKLAISPDGRTLSYLGPREDAFEYDDAYIVPLSGGPPRNLTGPAIDRRIWAYEWTEDNRIVVQALMGFHSTFYRCSQDGKTERLPELEVHPSGHYSYRKPFAARAGQMAYVGESTIRPPEIWLSTGPGKSERISRLNQEWDGIPVLPLEIFRYPSFDGIPIEAGLLKPSGLKDGARVPLVVIIHGGPSAKWSDRFHGWGQTLANRGVAVLFPNIRGSTGYGYQFLTANRKDWGGGDYKDVMAGVDYLIGKGIADPERLGIGGWSYGGYMSAWAITQTARFKAAVCGAPMTDLVSEFGTEDRWQVYYDEWYLGTPYDNLQLYMDRSPLMHVKKARAATLLMVGEKDDNTPVGQCLQFYDGLKRFAPKAELVIYPGSGHFPRKAEQRLDLHRRFVQWFLENLRP